jgi:hypothetical protein
VDWIRVDGNLPGHPKVTRLAELLCVPQATAVGYVVMLWCWAVQYAPEGGPVTAAVCSVCVRGGHGDKRVTRRVARLYDAFRESAVIDSDGMLHDWHVYQGAIVEKRERDREHARKSRERRATVARLNADSSATVATHETRRDVRDEVLVERDAATTTTESELPPEVDPLPGKFTRPTLEDLRAHIAEKHYTFTAEAFFAYYTANGWKVGRNAMKDWRAACVTWQGRELPRPAVTSKLPTLCRDCKQPMTKIETMEGTTCRACREDHGV